MCRVTSTVKNIDIHIFYFFYDKLLIDLITDLIIDLITVSADLGIFVFFL